VLLLDMSTELQLDMSTLQRHVLLLDVSTPQGPELQLDMSTPQGPELHLGMSTLQRHVLLLDMSTLQRHVLLLDVSTPQGPELQLDVSGQQEPLLFLERNEYYVVFVFPISKGGRFNVETLLDNRVNRVPLYPLDRFSPIRTYTSSLRTSVS
jgi:predicted transcriptional regulator